MKKNWKHFHENNERELFTGPTPFHYTTGSTSWSSKVREEN